MLFTKSILNIQNLIFLAGLIFTTIVQAQIENITITKEARIDKLYAGLLTNTELLSHENYQNVSSAQIGTRVYFSLIPKKLGIRTFGVFKQTERHQLQFFKSYEAIYNPNKNITIHLGLMATPTTELRPNPTTWQSQVETNSESNILGGRTGIKINYRINENLKVSYGVFKHNSTVANHIKLSYKQLAISSYLENENLFFALKWEDNTHNLILTRYKEVTSLSSIIPISECYSAYADIELNDEKQNINYLELGIRRFFSKNQFLKGFLTLNYHYHLKNIQGGLFIHI
ncbi:hypothetical protein [Aquimarina litoralis]|uniref:hypothetical protein n=1 Tax=Aquimarina litoralis TaxID=584605 RepID=UPI001C55C235|nr:hypothetical protein [Aquimarina litoralis]MBW1295699.1 hypothetical protein [Aquimarina litoralis]